MTYHIVDSSGWLEYFSASSNADFFADAIEDAEHLIVPVISVYEVFKSVLRERDEKSAFQAIAQMSKGTMVNLNMEIALSAARLGLMHKLPMADSIIFATASQYEAVILTQDRHFAGLPRVKFIQNQK